VLKINVGTHQRSGQRTKKGRPDRKAGRGKGVNDGLAFAMRGALQKRKEPAERAEAFFCLDFCATLDQAKVASLRGNERG